MTLAGVSLVAAIPALIVAGLMVSAFLNYAGQASNTLLAVVGLTLLCSAALALMPVGIFVFHGRQRGAAKQAAAKTAATSGDIPVTAMTAEFDATGEVDEASSEFEMSTGEFEADEFDDSEFIEIEDDEDEDQF